MKWAAKTRSLSIPTPTLMKQLSIRFIPPLVIRDKNVRRCSRLIVLEENYDRVIERLLAAAASLRVGNPEEPGITVGPVIDERSYQRILEIIEAGKTKQRSPFRRRDVPERRLLYSADDLHRCETGNDSDRQCEIFGPVLSVLKARDLDDAIEIANDTDYALTAGFFSRSPANIERVKAELVAGNVYVNRSCTGAVVGVIPLVDLR